MRKFQTVDEMKLKCNEVTTMLKAVAHPQRLMILCHLLEGEKNVSEILEQCQISQSQLSQFLNRMYREKILKVRKEGHFSYYSILDSRILELVQSLQKIFRDNKD